jgi:DNA replication ATP-dependent helicase Dna2
MNDPDSLDIYLDEIQSIISDKDSEPRKKFLLLRKIFRAILKQATEESNQFFSSSFGSLVYLIDKKNIQNPLANDLKITLHRFSKSAKDKNYPPDNSKISYTVRAITNLISHLKGQGSIQDVPSDTTDLLIDSPPISQDKTFDILRAVVKSFTSGPNPSIIFSTETGEEFEISLSDRWAEIPRLVRKGMTINLLGIEKDIKNSRLKTGFRTIIVLEPDFLIDVTEISECFQFSGKNPHIYFLSRIKNGGVSYNLALGNLVNSYFDELINNPEVNFIESFDRGIRSKPLSFIALAKSEKNIIQLLKDSSGNHFMALRGLIKKFKGARISVEPTFLSPVYGLQGRLDALLEYDDDLLRKDVLELKSGKAPGTNLTIKDDTGKIYQTGIWNNHFAQATCYNLLLDSAYTDRLGTSSIVYSSDPDNPIRNAPNIVQKKQEIAQLRNQIIFFERSLLNGNFKLFDEIHPDKFGLAAKFDLEFIHEFAVTYQSLDDLGREYFKEFYAFILREIFSEKMGWGDNGHRSGISSLWRDSNVEKEKSLYIISGLVPDLEMSDLTTQHICFRLDPSKYYASSFREGDIAILYHSDDNAFLNKPLIKGIIREINPERLIFSLRNKLGHLDLAEDSIWTIEPDIIDSNKKLFLSLFSLISSPPEKRDLILGRSSPNRADLNDYTDESLRFHQNELLRHIIAAEDYFLLQGPPGTGKTSFMLRAIIRYYLEKSDWTVLVLAYTNRAVDEICSSLDKLGDEVPYLRLGSKESTRNKSHLISYLVETQGMNAVYKMIGSCRILVATVSSVNYYPEIFNIFSFDMAVIDEASQLLEPQICGIISKMKKFIMIGDEKQLPAVVVQPPQLFEVKNELLKESGFNYYNTSMFERLLRLCIANSWEHAYGMLREQARMHSELMEFPNLACYDGLLSVFDDTGWQSEELEKTVDNIDSVLNLFRGKRLIFVATPTERISKLNRAEASIAALLANKLADEAGEMLDGSEIGVISPFRAQCAEIYSRLYSDYRQSINVDTVERFQGSEKDNIIISFALNYPRQLSMISSVSEFNGRIIDRKLNVAITRAKKRLVVIGNPEILSQSPVHKELLDFIKEKGTWLEYSDLKKFL